jgi:hypothetical protein
VSALDRATLLAVRAKVSEAAGHYRGWLVLTQWLDQQANLDAATPAPADEPDLLAALKSVIAILFNTPGRTMTDAESDAFWAAIAVIRKAEGR